MSDAMFSLLCSIVTLGVLLTVLNELLLSVRDPWRDNDE